MTRRDESRTDLGTIKIHKNVIASAASLAAAEIEGVKRIGGTFKSSITELFGCGFFPAIRVEFGKGDEVKLEVPVIIKYGFNIPDTAGKVQENVRLALEKMTSLCVKDINISVRGIERGQE